MPRCSKCGELNESNDVYCWKCGARLPPEFKVEGVDALLRDFRLQSLWALRLFAYLIDLTLVGILGFLLSIFSFIPLLVGSLFGGNWAWRGIWAVPLYLGLAQIVYSVILELIYGATFGKQILGLVVLSKRGGKPSLYGVVVRNLSKAHWVLLLMDFAAGVLPSHVPRDKYLDTISETYVTHSGRGLQIPFLARPQMMKSNSREIIPLDNIPRFDPFSILNLGVLLVVSMTILVNTPESICGFLSWIISLTQGSLVAPPDVLLVSGYWFFIAMGIWGIASGALRYVLRIYPLKSVQEVFNGVYSLVLAYFIRLYLLDAFSLTYFVESIFIFFLAQILFTVYLQRFSE
jgi:uncharacterized RDD family membrane protein YckC